MPCVCTWTLHRRAAPARSSLSLPDGDGLVTVTGYVASSNVKLREYAAPLCFLALFANGSLDPSTIHF